MYILSFDECALSILLIFLVIGFIRKEYRTRTNTLLNLMIWAIFVSAFCDLISAHLSNLAPENNGFAIGAVYVVNYIYFLAHNSILPFFVLFMYSSADMWDRITQTKALKYIWFFLFAINNIVLIANGWLIDVFHVSELAQYQRGPWIDTFYIVAGVWVIWLIKVMIKYKKLINRNKLHIIAFLLVFIVGGVVIQFFFDNFLVEGFSMALTVLFFMMMVKRGEAQINPITGALVYSEGIDRVTNNIAIDKPMSFIFFKIVNNKSLHMYLGTEEYNAFLKHVTDMLRTVSKENNFHSDLYYMENGLFTFMSTLLDKDATSQVAEKLLNLFNGEIKFDAFTVLMECGVCVAYYPEDVEDFSTLLMLATTFHETLDDNKSVHYYGLLKDNKIFRIKNELEDILKRALEHDGFRIYYQPIYSISEKRFIAAEALIRLKDKDYGFISPSIFIPGAEAGGLIHDIGDFVLNDVLKFMAEYPLSDLGLDYIEMNLSNSQCIETNLADKIRELLEHYQISPDCIGFGIQETGADINTDIVDATIRRLHDNGIRIALDGYGTGYSNIKRLTGLPIDQIKLDKKFVDMIDEPNMLIVIQDTIKMLKEMSKQILVEGVEKEEVAQKFSGLGADLMQGCQYFQGFYFCQPLPKDEFVEFIKIHQNLSE